MLDVFCTSPDTKHASSITYTGFDRPHLARGRQEHGSQAQRCRDKQTPTLSQIKLRSHRAGSALPGHVKSRSVPSGAVPPAAGEEKTLGILFRQIKQDTMHFARCYSAIRSPSITSSISLSRRPRAQNSTRVYMLFCTDKALNIYAKPF